MVTMMMMIKVLFDQKKFLTFLHDIRFSIDFSKKKTKNTPILPKTEKKFNKTKQKN